MKIYRSPKNVVVTRKVNGKEYTERAKKPKRYNPYKDKYLAMYSGMNSVCRIY